MRVKQLSDFKEGYRDLKLGHVKLKTKTQSDSALSFSF